VELRQYLWSPEEQRNHLDKAEVLITEAPNLPKEEEIYCVGGFFANGRDRGIERPRSSGRGSLGCGASRKRCRRSFLTLPPQSKMVERDIGMQGGGEAVELPKQRSCSATGRGEERFCLRMGGGWAESAAPNVRSVYGKAHFNIRPQTSARRALVVCPLQSCATGWGCDWIGDRNEGDAGGDRQDGGGVE